MTYGFIKKTLAAYGIDLENLEAGGGGTGPLAVAERQVATNCNAPTYFDTSAPAFMSKSIHYICEDLDEIAIEIPWYYQNTGGGFIESPVGNTPNAAAWIEYPKGVLTQLPINGLLTGQPLVDGGRKKTDYAAIRIPRFAQIAVWIRVFSASANRVLSQAGSGASSNNGNHGGEGLTTSGVTASSTPPVGLANNVNSSTVFRPCAILGQSTRRAFLVKGDSREFGVGEGRDGGYPDIGEICHALGAFRPFPVPYIKVAASGDSVASFLAASSGQRANTIALGAYVSDGVMQVGFNDLNGGMAAATYVTNANTAKALFATLGPTSWFQTTKGPASTGAWTLTDGSDQTTTANNGLRVSANNLIRAGLAGWTGFFEVADSQELTRDNGKVKAPGYTTDGTHWTILSMRETRDNGWINTAQFA